MNVEYLRTFCTVVETGSMAKAARLLSLTESAVSQEIRHLEEHLGVRLLTRTSRGVTLSPYGELVYARFRQIVALCTAVHDDIARQQAAATPDPLRIGTTAFTGTYVVPAAMAHVEAQFPGAPLILAVRRVPELLADLKAGALDLVIAEGDIRAWAGEATRHAAVIGYDPVVPVAAPNAPWVATVPIPLANWLTLPHVLCDASCTPLSLFARLAALRETPGKLHIAAQVESLETAKALVEAGVGVGLFPQRAVRRELQMETLVTVSVRGWRWLAPVAVIPVSGRAQEDPLSSALIKAIQASWDPRGRRRARTV